MSLRVVNESQKKKHVKIADIEILKSDVQVFKGGLGVIRLMITLVLSLLQLQRLSMSYISNAVVDFDYKIASSYCKSLSIKTVKHNRP